MFKILQLAPTGRKLDQKLLGYVLRVITSPGATQLNSTKLFCWVESFKLSHRPTHFNSTKQFCSVQSRRAMWSRLKSIVYWLTQSSHCNISDEAVTRWRRATIFLAHLLNWRVQHESAQGYLILIPPLTHTSSVSSIWTPKLSLSPSPSSTTTPTLILTQPSLKPELQPQPQPLP